VEKIKDLVNSPFTKCSVALLIGALLIINKDVLYAGISFGIGIREFFFSFSKDCPRNCKKDCCIK